MPGHDFLNPAVTMTKILTPPPTPTMPILDVPKAEHCRPDMATAFNGVQNTSRVLRRHPSAPSLSISPLVPGLHLTETVLHLEKSSPVQPGDLAVNLSKESDWRVHTCAAGSLLGSVEMYKGGGLFNLVASAQFTEGKLSQTAKRELECAVVATISSYNQTMTPKDDNGAPRTLSPKELPITLHENHLVGDGKTHADRQIPRAPNPFDYQRYHRLGAPFAENGKMQPHYHLEFNTPLTRTAVGDLLNTLHSMGKVIAGREIISAADIEHVLNLLPAPMKNDTSHLAQIKANRALTPAELESEAQKTSARDYFRGELHALSSANTEKHGAPNKLAPLNNMHMNSFRPIEPQSLLACFANGHTGLVEDLEHVESIGTTAARPPSTRELFELYSSFQRAIGDLATTDGVSLEERQQAEAIRTRLLDAMHKTRTLLAPP